MAVGIAAFSDKKIGCTSKFGPMGGLRGLREGAGAAVHSSDSKEFSVR